MEAKNNIKRANEDYLNYVLPKSYEILDILKHTDLEWTFKVKFDKEVKPGQFLQVSLAKIGEAPISVSGMGDGFVEMTIRNVGEVTSKLFKSKAGDYIFLRGPYGNGWPLSELKGKNVVVIAGGTGVSPVRGLIEYIRDNPDEFGSLYLILGFKNHESVLFKDDLEKWRKSEKINTIYSLDNEEIEGFRKGMVTAFIPELPFDSFDGNYSVVMVGPPIMMRFTSLGLLKEGVLEDKIWTSFERKMSCAVGKCGHCRINETYVCLDGPVFPYTVAKDLLD
ncbi:anaerobic sulfite reductase subunit AsrB [Anaerococcus porci]|uniref:anaerobic sulfite reductase subunit AsrB n=1 Tax=Anaerococcus porci TaxID=2652269 RepID=UPI002A75B4CE|nr:anaerobic sulfite reductase subunit AsrB [Anaerococcus porci]MDY3005543.1 anaerobic sulfite reductase subunit AsrB [Anaerococcus porci]